MSDDGAIAKALLDTLFSPNEWDRKMETANVVDGLFAIARAIDRLARTLEDGAPFKVEITNG